MDGTAIPKRHGPRHSQISIRLHAQLDGDWQMIEAQQWNEVGFNFFHAHEHPLGSVSFKRSLQRFGGEVVWSKAFRDESIVLEMLLNGAIHTQAESLQSQPDMQQRLLNLMRVQGMVASKQKVLAALGGQVTADYWAARVRERLEKPLFQYGVRVESPAWRAVVAEALPMGDLVRDLERWSGSLQSGGATA